MLIYMNQSTVYIFIRNKQYNNYMYAQCTQDYVTNKIFMLILHVTDFFLLRDFVFKKIDFLVRLETPSSQVTSQREVL